MKEPVLPSARSDVVLRTIEGDHVVYDPLVDKTLLLNPTAFVILELADGTRTVEAIAEELCARFDVPRPTAERDVAEALRVLSTNGIVSGFSARADGPDAPRAS